MPPTFLQSPQRKNPAFPYDLKSYNRDVCGIGSCGTVGVRKCNGIDWDGGNLADRPDLYRDGWVGQDNIYAGLRSTSVSASQRYPHSAGPVVLQRLNAHLHMLKKPDYLVNLDPAVRTVPYSPNIDIRDTVNYKEVMKQWAPDAESFGRPRH